MNNEQLSTTSLTYCPTVSAAPAAATYSLYPVTYSLNYAFSAKERDAETGLSYFGARYYSSDLSIWLSVDPMSDKYPSLSSYVYCANNPVKLVDPNGEELVVASNEESHNDILSIVNEYNRDRVTFGEDGKVIVNMEGLKTEDAGLSLLNDMSLSNKKYYFETSDVALCRNENGAREIYYLNNPRTKGCINASNGGFDSNGKYTQKPIDGYDGQVVLSKSGSFRWGTMDRRKNVVFHELKENFLRTDKGMNYLGPNDVGAHRTAARMEFKAWGTFEAGAADYYPGKSKLNPTDQQRCINYLNYGKY